MGIDRIADDVRSSIAVRLADEEPRFLVRAAWPLCDLSLLYFTLCSGPYPADPTAHSSRSATSLLTAVINLSAAGSSWVRCVVLLVSSTCASAAASPEMR